MMEVDDSNCSLGLYDVLDSTLRQFKALRVQETSTCIDLNNHTSFTTHKKDTQPYATSSASNTAAHANSCGAKKAQGVQLVLPGTGRMNFVKKVNDASELFRVLGKGSSSSSRDGASGNEDLSIEQLSLDNKKRPAGVTANGSTNSNKKPSNSNVVKGAPIVKAAASMTGSAAKPSTNAMGSAAAKARMAALGEDWPEEEELPGFTPASSSLASGGGASKDAMKMANNSMQRQKKVIIAKKKT